ncbi:inositol-pentakisphosphate 2-kinase domain-containing protein [Ditylenchus destructor]|nr:inositol-pentakisphosphate 2-kinase domain-containing protein [Ditylenchus destructor]
MSMNDLFIDPDSSLSGPTAVVDPANYRSFCFRGEGRCNFVISAKESKSNLRIVWRLAKHRKSGTMTTKPKCEIKMVSPFLRDDYLISKFIYANTMALNRMLSEAKIVHIQADHLHQLAKIPSLPHNFKIERWEELKDELKYPAGVIKLFAIEKWRSAAFDTMYDFCPLDLYSGERDRMRGSIRSLIHDPHRNLRIFVDGDVVHDEDSQLNRSQLNAVLFPHAAADVDTFISVVYRSYS